MICSNCGKDLSPFEGMDIKFCPFCNSPIQEVTEETPDAPPEPGKMTRHERLQAEKKKAIETTPAEDAYHFVNKDGYYDTRKPQIEEDQRASVAGIVVISVLAVILLLIIAAMLLYVAQIHAGI